MPEELIAEPQAMDEAQYAQYENYEGYEQYGEEAGTAPEAEEEPLFELKYNHEVVKKPYSEVKDLAQMGMNYPKVISQLEELKNDEALRIADRIASGYGVSRSELLRKWEAVLEEQTVNDYAEENGITPEVAKELIETKRIAGALLAEKRAQEDKVYGDARIEAAVEEFREEFPDVRDEDVPDEVLMEWAKGVPLNTAFKAYQAEGLKEAVNQMEGQLRVIRTNSDNEASSMGSVQTLGSAAPLKIDAEWIKRASQKEIEAHWNEIWDLKKSGKL